MFALRCRRAGRRARRRCECAKMRELRRRRREGFEFVGAAGWEMGAPADNCLPPVRAVADGRGERQLLVQAVEVVKCPHACIF